MKRNNQNKIPQFQILFLGNLIFIFILICFTENIYAQLNMKQLISFKLGDSYLIAKPKITERFSQNPIVLKGDFLNTYKIEYENVPFDYYGNGNYSFFFVKDKLVSISLAFFFYSGENQKFQRLYNAIINDFSKDNTKVLLSEYSNLNPKDIFQYVESECKKTTTKDDINYQPIKEKFLGQNIWAIQNSSFPSAPIIYLGIGLLEWHLGSIVSIHGSPVGYNGGIVNIILEVTSDQFQDLKNQAYEQSINYSLYTDEITEIPLKLQNGVYQLPVNINHVITLDFILDLGASDVSISPDVFLTLYKSGTIQDSDFIGNQSYKFADGSTATSKVFNIESLTIGNIEINNVSASISNNVESPLLLGQSALKKLHSYRIDNKNGKLIIE